MRGGCAAVSRIIGQTALYEMDVTLDVNSDLFKMEVMHNRIFPTFGKTFRSGIGLICD